MLVHLPDDIVDGVAQFLEAGAVASAFGPVDGLSRRAKAACDHAVREREACALTLAHSLAGVVTRTAARNNPRTGRPA